MAINTDTPTFKRVLDSLNNIKTEKTYMASLSCFDTTSKEALYTDLKNRYMKVKNLIKPDKQKYSTFNSHIINDETMIVISIHEAQQIAGELQNSNIQEILDIIYYNYYSIIHNIESACVTCLFKAYAIFYHDLYSSGVLDRSDSESESSDSSDSSDGLEYIDVLDNLLAIKPSVSKRDVHSFKGLQFDLKEYIDTCVKTYSAFVHHDNYRALINHKLYEYSTFKMGYYVHVSGVLKPIDRYSLKALICNIYTLYDMKKKFGCNKCFYLMVSAMIFTYVSFDCFAKALTNDKAVVLFHSKNLSAFLVDKIQSYYLETKADEYMHLLNLLLRLNTTVFNSIIKNIKKDLINDGTLYYRCKYPKEKNYTLFDINKTYDILTLVNKFSDMGDFTKEEQTYICLNKGYCLIGEAMSNPIFDEIIDEHYEDIYKMDIDMSMLYDAINPCELGGISESNMITLYRAGLIYAANKKGLDFKTEKLVL